MDGPQPVTNSFMKLLALSPFERWILFHALWMLPLIACALRFAGFERCQSILIRLASALEVKTPGPRQQALAEACAAARTVDIAARHGWHRPRCLQKSLVLWWLMRRRGLPADLWFGVRKEETGLDAHAWIEYDGVVLNDLDDVRERFAAFKSPFSSAGLRLRHAQRAAITGNWEPRARGN
jgi:hypothetical protein